MNERMAHILQHQEMAGMEAEIARALQSPAEVRVSCSDNTVQLFYFGSERPQLGANQPRFLAAFSARFSMSVLAGFFLVSFFCCMPLAIAFLL
jgi:hypothetical protein